MRLPHIHMSNGAWIFASAIGAAVILSGGAYAVSNTIMAIGNANGTTTAYVTPNRQLQTVTTAPTNLVTASGVSGSTCATVYTPPAGKAIIVTEVNYDVGDGTAGHETYGALTDSTEAAGYDYVDSTQAYETESHTFPTGLAMPNVAICREIGNAGLQATISGYLIPASQLPPEPPRLRVKGSPRQ